MRRGAATTYVFWISLQMGNLGKRDSDAVGRAGFREYALRKLHC
jgi:hypothetical protein